MMFNPWVLLGGLLALISVATASFGFGHHVEHLAFEAYRKSQAAAVAKQVADNRSALLDLQQADRAKIDQINQTHEEQVNAITQRRDDLLAANRALSQRLYVRVASPVSDAAVPQTGTGVTVDAQTGVAELSGPVAQYLITEAARADQLAADYAALQKVIIEDRETCNGQLPGAASTQ